MHGLHPHAGTMGEGAMTRDELINILRRYLLTDGVAQHALSLIWGQPFDGETEKIKPTAEESSVVGNSGNETDFVTKTMSNPNINDINNHIHNHL